MRIFDKVDLDMVTDFVSELPKYCVYCGARCWRTDDYPFACRCSGCSSYFHREVLSCVDLGRGGCSTQDDLYLFELLDRRLVEVCSGCVNWLCEQGVVE